MNAELFIKRFLPVALKVEEETGFKPGILRFALLTQSAHETGWGKSVKANNYFGIKGRGQWFRTKEVYASPDLKFPGATIHSVHPVVTLPFSSYHNPIDSFYDYVRFIRENPRYKKAVAAETIEEYLSEIARAGYGTDPEMETKLLNVLKSVRKRL